MEFSNKVLIIIPVFNEGKILKDTLEEVFNFGFDVLVVDDGSTDNCCGDINGQKRIKVIRHVHNFGQGAALKSGMTYAIENGYDICFHFDADGQHDPIFFDTYLDKIINDKADIVLGSRFINFEYSQTVPKARWLLLRIALVVDRLFSGINLTDVHNGFRALNLNAMKMIQITSNGMEHASEIIWEIKRNNLNYTEIPVRIRYHKQKHKKGQSVITALDIFIKLILLKINLKRLKNRSSHVVD